MKKIIIFILAIVAVLITAIASAAQTDLLVDPQGERFSSVSTTEFAPDEVVVEFTDDATEKESDDIISDNNGKKGYESRYKRIKIVKMPPGKTFEEYENELELDSKVKDVRRNYILRADFIPNDPVYSFQWHFDNPAFGGIHMPEAWEKSTGQGVIVAVLDTGVSYENYSANRITYGLAPDLANTTFVPGYDFINLDDHPNDDDGHGTHVTGTIAQSTNDNYGVAGIAYNASIMPVKVLGPDGGTTTQVADGIRFAADNGAKVINMSLGGGGADPYLEASLQYAYESSVTIIASSGNDSAEQVGYPAAYDDYVIAVGATTYNEQRAWYSNGGASLDIVAPGGDTRTGQDLNGDGYVDGVLQETFASRPPYRDFTDFGWWFYQGTSMAAPHVSGVAALILASNPSFTPDQVRNSLQSSADDLYLGNEPDGWDSDFGWGLLNADAALPSVSISITTDGQVAFGTLDLNVTTSTAPGDHEIISIDAGTATLSVSSTNFSDGSNNWTLASATDADQVILEFSRDNNAWSTFLQPNAYYLLAADVSQNDTESLYLRLTMPTSSLSASEYSSNITILATLP